MPIDPETGKFKPAPEQRTLPPEDDPAEIERAAEVTQEDVDAAAAYWREHAPGDLKGLIDAEPYEGE